MSSKGGVGLGIVGIIIAGIALGLVTYNFFIPDHNIIEDNIYYCSTGEQVQDAINTIGSGNGKVIIIKNISISDTIDINGNGDYIVEGASSITLRIEANISSFNISNARSCVIRDLTIDGSSIDNGGVSLLYIKEKSQNSIHIQNIRFLGKPGNTEVQGIYIRSNNIWVENCQFKELYTGIFIFWSQLSHFYHNSFKDINDTGIYALYVCQKSVIEGNTIENCDNGIALHSSWAVENIISNNEIYHIHTAGILLNNSELNAIIGNRLDDTTIVRDKDVYGILLIDSDGNSIEGNVISRIVPLSSGDGYGIYLDNGDNNCIVGNIFNEIPIDIWYTGTSTGNIIDNNISI
ncbi:MAG: right-handed parallel beta-helix repeat-containing protein [Candidatus Lokiarchaeota archaeon]|nr:right-handed parallel beta-helix repeat-containing protein [Candidatus Lokiarchaeota archaeon]